MITIDASAVVELLIRGPLAKPIEDALRGSKEALISPHLLDIEVLSALRTLAAARKVDTRDTERMLAELGGIPIHRYPHAPLLSRIWELRQNFTVYDAVYLALAEASGATLYTCDDAKLAKGHRARVKVFR